MDVDVAIAEHLDGNLHVVCDQEALRSAIFSWLAAVEAAWEEKPPAQVRLNEATRQYELVDRAPVQYPTVLERSPLETELVTVQEPAMRALVFGICAVFSAWPSFFPRMFLQRERELMQGHGHRPSVHPWSPRIILPMSLAMIPDLRQLLRRPDVYETLGRLPSRQWQAAGTAFLITALAVGDLRRERQRSAKARQRRDASKFPGLTPVLRQVMMDMPDGAGNIDYLMAILDQYPQCSVTLEKVRKARSLIRKSHREYCDVH
jgi:hypothetical protein